jgi:hypothetical protein
LAGILVNEGAAFMVDQDGILTGMSYFSMATEVETLSTGSR